jgi:hypothetical protein
VVPAATSATTVGELLDFSVMKPYMFIDHIPAHVGVAQVSALASSLGRIEYCGEVSCDPGEYEWTAKVTFFSRKACARAVTQLDGTNPFGAQRALRVNRGKVPGSARAARQAMIMTTPKCVAQLNATMPLRWSSSLHACHSRPACRAAGGAGNGNDGAAATELDDVMDDCDGDGGGTGVTPGPALAFDLGRRSFRCVPCCRD